MYKVLVSKNTIVIDEECHDRILENIITREHLDYDDFFSHTEDSDTSDSSSSDEDSV